MKVSETLIRFGRESISWQVKFLSRLGHWTTILARNTYEFDSDGVSDPRQLRCLNEIQHRIFGQQLKLLVDDKSRYPDDLFIKMIDDMARSCGITDIFSFEVEDLN